MNDATLHVPRRFGRAAFGALKRSRQRREGAADGWACPSPDPAKALAQFRRHLAAVGFRRSAVRWHEDPSVFGRRDEAAFGFTPKGAAGGLSGIHSTTVFLLRHEEQLLRHEWDREPTTPRFFMPRPGNTVAFDMGINATSANIIHGTFRQPDPYRAAWNYFASGRPEPWTIRFAFRFHAPLFRAWESGLSLFYEYDGIFHCLEAPVEAHAENGRLHRADGPAVVWRSGFRLFYWKGTLIPRAWEERVFGYLGPTRVRDILGERNVEMRRCAIDRYGVGPFLVDAGAKEVHRDDFGVLLRLESTEDEPIQVVKVVNSTPEPDGSFKDYFLRVPPQITTAREGVAWTFGLVQAARPWERRPGENGIEAYRPEKQT